MRTDSDSGGGGIGIPYLLAGWSRAQPQEKRGEVVESVSESQMNSLRVKDRIHPQKVLRGQMERDT